MVAHILCMISCCHAATICRIPVEHAGCDILPHSTVDVDAGNIIRTEIISNLLDYMQYFLGDCIRTHSGRMNNIFV